MVLRECGKPVNSMPNEVGLTQPNPFELHDMHGNLREGARRMLENFQEEGSDRCRRRPPTRVEWAVGGCSSPVLLFGRHSAAAHQSSFRNPYFGFRVACVKWPIGGTDNAFVFRNSRDVIGSGKQLVKFRHFVLTYLLPW